MAPEGADPAPRPKSDESFGRERRLLTKRDFGRAFADGRRVHAPEFRLVIRKNDSDLSRLGLAVGKRVHKHANVRNRVKRQLREIFRRAGDRVPPGLDVVVVPTEKILELDFEALREKFFTQLDRRDEPRRPRKRRPDNRRPGRGSKA